MTEYILITAGVGLFGLVIVGILAYRVLQHDPGNETMQKISGYIYSGAMAFLSREYRYILVFVVLVVIAIALGIDQLNGWTWLSYLVGALCSLLAGFVGMQISTRSNCRTAEAAKKGFNPAIRVAFWGGSVMGLTVVSIGCFAMSLLFILFAQGSVEQSMLVKVTNYLAGFSMGASSVALFARVGGGIYTKAADVGADLVGKVEKNIPEDDPRNPAVIADLVGDNVGDVAGMGADLYESYVGAIVSALVIAASTVVYGIYGITLAFLLAGIGIIASILGIFFVRTGKKANPQLALRYGTIAASVLFVIGAFFLIYFLPNPLQPGIAPGSNMMLFWAVLAGLIPGMSIGFVAEYYTSGKMVVKLSEQCKTGSATNIINGFGISMESTVLPLILIALGTIVSYHFAGIYGMALAAIGMLATAGMTVAVDAYGPIADNSGGIAEMSHMDPEVRKITDKLDAAGNTTAAIAKGFAIGSAALTALALFMAFAQSSNLFITTPDGKQILNVNLLDPYVVGGLFIGGIIPFMFAGLTMRAVGKAAHSVVDEVRWQFENIKGLMEGTAEANYARCVDITTRGAIKEMIAPGILAILIPLMVGIVLGVNALAGMLAGALVVGVPLAIMLANAGGAWDNTKKYIEEGHHGGKGSEAHKAGVVGDTVGDPFKDTAAPAMNILLKLMTVVSLVFTVFIQNVHNWLLSLLY